MQVVYLHRFASIQESTVMNKNRPSLPARKAFVVQLHADTQAEPPRFKGRVEHIVSYQATHFESLEELVAFMLRVLAEQEA